MLQSETLLEMLTVIEGKLNHALKLNPSVGVSLVKEAQFGLGIILKMLRENEGK